MIALQKTDEGREIRIVERGGCTLIMTPVDTDLFLFLSKRNKKATLSGDLARLAGARFAIGLKKDIEALREALIDEKRPSHQAKHAESGLSPEAVEWLLSGRHGTSSAFFFWKATGWKPEILEDRDLSDAPAPRDLADFARCKDLADAVPECRANLASLSSLSRQWANIVGGWEKLSELVATASSKDSKDQAAEAYLAYKAILEA